MHLQSSDWNWVTSSHCVYSIIYFFLFFSFFFSYAFPPDELKAPLHHLANLHEHISETYHVTQLVRTQHRQHCKAKTPVMMPAFEKQPPFCIVPSGSAPLPKGKAQRTRLVKIQGFVTHDPREGVLLHYRAKVSVSLVIISIPMVLLLFLLSHMSVCLSVQVSCDASICGKKNNNILTNSESVLHVYVWSYFE